LHEVQSPQCEIPLFFRRPSCGRSSDLSPKGVAGVGEQQEAHARTHRRGARVWFQQVVTLRLFVQPFIDLPELPVVGD
jgi:hypothetical protein